MAKVLAVPNSNPPAETLSGQIRGFCTGLRAREAILNYGIAGKHIYQFGVGAEDFNACIHSFRGRAGCLVVSEGMLAFGRTKKLISECADTLEKADIRIVDLSHPEDQSYAAQVARAHNSISHNHFAGDRQKARRRGATGGKARGTAMWNKRDDIAPKWLIDRIVNHGLIPWRVKLQLLAPYFTKATLYRHYGLKPTMGRRDNVGAA